MECPRCARDTSPTQVFCVWCDAFVPSPAAGVRAGGPRRFVATVVDLAATAAVPGSAVAALGPGVGAAVGAAVLAPVVAVWMLKARGRTPGKCLLGLRVVDAESGRAPGAGRLVVRELLLKPPGLLASALDGGASVRDRGGAPWHDRRAGTVVVADRLPNGE